MSMSRALKLALVLPTALLMACQANLHGMAGLASGSASAKGLWSSGPALHAGIVGGQIATPDLDSTFLKDPSFVNGGQPVAGQRLIAFSDLRRFYLKAFDVQGQQLAFQDGSLPIGIRGLDPALDSVWAPQLRAVGSQLELLYCAGAMPPPNGPLWGSFRLHRATIASADFAAALGGHHAPQFQDRGPILADPSLGPNDAMIDPCLFVNRRGKAYMTYTVVKAGVPGQRNHEEFVRYRRVDPADVSRALGPETALYDGRAGTEDDGVAEAQDVVTLNDQAYAFVSSRPGDGDQRILVAPVSDDLGTPKRESFHPFLYPGAEAWKARAVGSSSAAVIGKTAFMIYQGLDAQQRFTLGWTTLTF